ncbi:hypothetical protein [Natrinema pallidum]|uniref:hypothetical protein n=1 Tax=Natrinema pallidum TaxID=69527 RepID=UPI003750815C
MRRIQHPRATEAFARGPPSKAAVEIKNGLYRTANLDEDGNVLIPDRYADSVMDGHADQYGVEYDRDAGEVLEPESDDDPDAGSVTDDGDVGELPEPEDPSDDDLEAWANWNKDDWLSLGYQSRLSDVEDGLVDDHLEEVIDAESNQSKQVHEAAKQRLRELEANE